MQEEALLTGPLEPTNEPYALAKIAGIRMCDVYNRQYGTNFISAMLTNLYGPGDNFDLENSHVIPAIIRKIHLGKCLEQGDWQSMRADLDQRPIAGIDGAASEESILQELDKQGISLSTWPLQLGGPERFPMGYEDYADNYFLIADKFEEIFHRSVDLIT